MGNAVVSAFASKNERRGIESTSEYMVFHDVLPESGST